MSPTGLEARVGRWGVRIDATHERPGIDRQVPTVVERVAGTVRADVLDLHPEKRPSGPPAPDRETVDLPDDVITMHLELTGSAVAERLLSNWFQNVRQFTKIFPKDYKRVLEAQRDAVERGVDVDEGDHGGGSWVRRRGS